MSVKEEFYYPSAAQGARIHAVRYIPDGGTRAVMQISHGMVEYIERYEEFAEFLCGHGILVTGNDHLGHGGTAADKTDYGYFADRDGNKCVLEDLHTLTKITKKLYPDLPYFLLGHSMGSFYARQYLIDYGYELSGAVIMGTGHQPLLLVKLGKFLAKSLAGSKGWRYRSDFLNNMAFGGYNKKFEPSRTRYDWLSKNNEEIDRYSADERCTFTFTLNGYYNMFTGIERLHDKYLLSRMPKNLPVFFVSGEDDPVGDFSKGVKAAYATFIDAGMENLKIKLYPGDRHEILKETDRQTVFEDILAWTDEVLND